MILRFPHPDCPGADKLLRSLCIPHNRADFLVLGLDKLSLQFGRIDEFPFPLGAERCALHLRDRGRQHDRSRLYLHGFLQDKLCCLCVALSGDLTGFLDQSRLFTLLSLLLGFLCRFPALALLFRGELLTLELEAFLLGLSGVQVRLADSRRCPMRLEETVDERVDKLLDLLLDRLERLYLLRRLHVGIGIRDNDAPGVVPLEYGDGLRLLNQSRRHAVEVFHLRQRSEEGFEGGFQIGLQCRHLRCECQSSACHVVSPS